MNDTLSRLERELTHADTERILSDLVSIPSHPEAPGAEGPLAEFIARFFQAQGIEVEISEAAPGRPNLTARVRGTGGGRTLLLCGHLDTVPPYGMRDPFSPRVRDGYLYGRGSTDMKAGLAAMMAALAAVRRAGISLARDLAFGGVADEELGSLGAGALARSGFKADGAIIGEPTELRVCLGHRGLEWLEAEFLGRTVHGGDQDRGINAIVHAARFIGRIESELAPALKLRRHPLLGPSTVNIGKIEGGTQPSTVAGECRVLIDRRYLPSERYEEVLSEFRVMLEESAKGTPGLRTSLKVMDASVMAGGLVHAPSLLAEDHPLALACREAFPGPDGKPAPFIAFPAWTDAGVLSEYAKIPTVICGPGKLESAHSDGECVELAQVRACALAYARTALEFCVPRTFAPA